ncbi:hypothetical protein CDAR_492411 [Caerostris darwini]|uniref:Uncharacterized protein n=1 Tax=Caerostris darwini TaxID=1538125 RepID=A0AAV4UZD9_9ARAC|nr:hypothetical protein CDAR_492411 [Caerostris darwini]
MLGFARCKIGKDDWGKTTPFTGFLYATVQRLKINRFSALSVNDNSLSHSVSRQKNAVPITWNGTRTRPVKRSNTTLSVPIHSSTLQPSLHSLLKHSDQQPHSDLQPPHTHLLATTFPSPTPTPFVTPTFRLPTPHTHFIAINSDLQILTHPLPSYSTPISKPHHQLPSYNSPISNPIHHPSSNIPITNSPPHSLFHAPTQPSLPTF